MNHLLSVKDLEVSFYKESKEIRAVKGVNFHIEEGEIYGIVGESGSGKSVATKSILRLGPDNCKIKNGEILFEGDNILEKNNRELRKIRGNEISIIFQDSLTSLNPVYTIGDKLVELIRRNQKISKSDAKKRAIELLDIVGIADSKSHLKSYPHELSGGMRQRVMIAMAISSNPKIIIADEPTTALDVTIQKQILYLLKDLQKKLHTSIILITHDLGVVAQMCSRIAVMCAGYIVEEGTTEDIFYHPSHPYTKALIASVPKAGRTLERFIEKTITEEENENLCPFFSRCSYAIEKCRLALPDNYLENDKHSVRCYVRGEKLGE
ncbi:ABC transporter ATP-binding protein [Anaeromicropila herbilytica]|uniref:Peptide ABC transporter ATP-binding protein n=1 Tax=Anaeromicropila herbilytica TaxID=2785025 RepID=A0A7R7IFI5_9FIRM|nr:ABC transporter ATP-binding protein [Anaeromicropila herbilytica]BCN32183.1 peptide ABC transporter ATP-binding protein [Anaeromicropila herbilytica]